MTQILTLLFCDCCWGPRLLVVRVRHWLEAVAFLSEWPFIVIIISTQNDKPSMNASILTKKVAIPAVPAVRRDEEVEPNAEQIRCHIAGSPLPVPPIATATTATILQGRLGGRVRESSEGITCETP